jgi:hypothetical protein
VLWLRQLVTCRLLTADFQVQSKGSWYEIFGEESGIEAGFSAALSCSPASYYSTSAPYSLVLGFRPVTLSLYSSLNIGDEVSHLYKTTDKIIVLNVLIFTFLYSRHEGKVSDERIILKLIL